MQRLGVLSVLLALTVPGLDDTLTFHMSNVALFVVVAGLAVGTLSGAAVGRLVVYLHDVSRRDVRELLEDRPQTRLELGDHDVLLVDRDPLVRGVLHHDLADVDLLLLLGGLGFRRQVDVEPLLREWQGRHEDDEQHEQHVDHRRDVHFRRDFELLGRDDAIGAEVLVGVSH